MDDRLIQNRDDRLERVYPVKYDLTSNAIVQKNGLSAVSWWIEYDRYLRVNIAFRSNPYSRGDMETEFSDRIEKHGDK